MSAGKGDAPRPVKGEKYRRNYETIFRKFTEQEPTKGEVIDGHEYLGHGGWHAIDQHETELRDEES